MISQRIRVPLLFMTIAWFYLIAGIVILVLEETGIISMGRDPVFLIWFFGFVMEMIMGVSTLFLPSRLHDQSRTDRRMLSELILVNAGIITMAVGLFSKNSAEALVIVSGLTLIVAAVVLHLIGLTLAVFARTQPGSGRRWE
ncbi:MAG: hypothetical protein QXV22_04710 [Thermoplasmataceae archaeon]